ncbi:hypothetical protein GMB10_04255, partial [Turicibacter sanguinis]|nr:hypothetical protein [Turicibacter sanguinis]
YHDYLESIKIYTEGIQYNPNVSVLYYNRACCYALMENKEAALEDLIIANQLSPSLLEYMEKDDELVQVRQMPAYQNAFSVK